MNHELSREQLEGVLDALGGGATRGEIEVELEGRELGPDDASDAVAHAIDEELLVVHDDEDMFPTYTVANGASGGEEDDTDDVNPTPDREETALDDAEDGDIPASWGDVDFTTADADTYPPTLLEREQWMGRKGKQPFAPWADADAPAPCNKNGHTTADKCDCDARWKWGYTEQYGDGETVEIAEDDHRLDGRVFLLEEGGPFAFVDGDDVRCPETGEVHPEFVDLLEQLGVTYADVSTSGSGVHAYYGGDLPDEVKEPAFEIDTEPWGANNDTPSVELYASKHVCVATGDRVDGAPLDVVEWDTDALEELLDQYDQFPDEPRATSREEFDLDGYEPKATGAGETTDEIRDQFHAVDRLDARDVARRTIVKQWNDDASTSSGARAFYPTWGSSSDSGTANYVNEDIWHDTGDVGGYGGPAVMALIDAGEISNRDASPSDARGENWFLAMENLRELGFDIPKLEEDEERENAGVGGEEPPKATTDGGATTDDGPLGLSPTDVAVWAGLGKGEDVSDLDDREKAAAVWELTQANEKYHIRVLDDNGAPWAYDDGIWKPTGEDELRFAAREGVGPTQFGQNLLAELVEQAKATPEVRVDTDDLGVPTGSVAVENGLVDLEEAADGGDALTDLKPEHYALTRLPVEYDPDAEYDEWQSYVEEWAEDGRADALQEYVGYCLHIGEIPIHRALLLVGSGANGKGTFLHVVRELLGSDNTSSTELQTLANERDAVADFYGSIANIDDDLSARGLGSGLGMFKKLVAGDRVRARHLYESGFEFDATGKHLYAANEVPDVTVPDDDEAFWRRWLLVEFPNHYPPSEREPTLSDRLSEPEALSGVLNWAIEGWARLLDQGYFTNEEREGYAKRERWQAWGESVDQFISECVEKDPDADRLTTQDAHRRYAAWCRENGEEPVGQMDFTNTLKEEDVGYKTSIKIDGRSERGYAALGLSDDVPDLDDTPDRGSSGGGRQDSLT